MFVNISEFYWIFASGIVLVMTSQSPHQIRTERVIIKIH